MSSQKYDPKEEMSGSLVKRGAINTGLAQALKLVLQLCSVAILSRLLSPNDFGLLAMAGPIVAFLAMFQNLGLTQLTVQRPTISHKEINFLFWISTAAGVVVTLVILLIAPVAAAFYGEPDVGLLVAGLALPFLITSSGAQHIALINRRMEFGNLAIIDVATSAVTLIVVVGWALYAPSFWALWAGAVAGAVVSISLSWIYSRWRPSMPRWTEEGWGMIKFGSDLTGFNLANFFARNLDNVIIGKVSGSVSLGLYERAYKLLLFPLTQVTNPLSQVMLPTLSRLVSEPGRYRYAFIRVMRLMLLAILPGVAAAIAMADTLIPFFLGEKWVAAIPIFQALGFAAMVQPLNNPAGWLFISQGRSRDFLWCGLATAVIAISAFALGITWGPVGVAVCYAVSEILKTPILWWFVCRKGPIRLYDFFGQIWPFIVGGLLAILIIMNVLPYLPKTPFLTLALGTFVAYSTVLLFALITKSGRLTVSEITKAVSTKLSGSGRA